MKVLDLFSGIGGFSLGLERAGMETVAFCEIEKFPQKVLKKHWPEVPIYDDIRKLTRQRLIDDGILADPGCSGVFQYGELDDALQKNKKQRGVQCDGVQGGQKKEGQNMGGKTIDLVCGGFPCQPFSQAGKQEGFDDDRDLWPEMFRVIQEVRPRWVIGENVAGFVSMGLDRTLTDLEGEGYRTEQVIIPACAVGAPHRRDRVWIVAHSEGERTMREPGEFCQKDGGSGRSLQGESLKSSDVAHSKRNTEGGAYGSDSGGSERGREKQNVSQRDEMGGDSGNSREDVADSDKARRGEQRGTKPIRKEQPSFERHSEGTWSQWAVEPDVGRVAHGIPSRVDRLKGLGNAVVPQIPEIIGRYIIEVESEPS